LFVDVHHCHSYHYDRHYIFTTDSTALNLDTSTQTMSRSF